MAGVELGGLTRRDSFVALALAAVVLVAGFVRLVPGVVGAFHDDAVYAITAKALAQGGGYHLINLPGAPPQTKYPILYPAALALLWRSASTLEARLLAMQVATLVAAALALAAAYLYVVRFRYVERVPALAAGVLCASAPNVLYYASAVLSEMPFALLVVASLWTTEAYVRVGPTTPRRALGAGIVAALPFLCRSAGIVVPVAALVIAARARRSLLWMLAGVALVTLPWILWMVRGVGGLAAEPIVGYQQDYLGHWSTGYFGYGAQSRLVLAATIFGTNVLKACTAIGEIAFEGMTRSLYAYSERAWVLTTALGAAAWLAIAVRARRLELLPFTLLAYLALICSWPWPPDRFLIPILFFLAAAIFALVARAAKRILPSRFRSLAVAVALTAVVPLNVQTLAEYASVSTRAHFPYFMLPDTPVAWASYRDAFAWLDAHAAADDVLAADFDSMTALYTGHPTIRPFVPRPSSLYYGGDAPPLGSPSDLVSALATYRVRYLFVSPMPAFPEEDAFYELVGRVQAEHPGLLRPMYRGSDPRFVVFEIGPADTTADRPR
ncbi:MAG: hypothetical protein HY271_11250 [Deltaproteobacteria bacterium]|nr:hypothetical protein [Deltaproteobacteria bacterium]